ncbi:MAG: hypothetical protein KDE22_13990 [Rhodobacterales bacterium]|nr:hypothetical protein [Rhodobacterales bacterium]
MDKPRYTPDELVQFANEFRDHVSWTDWRHMDDKDAPDMVVLNLVYPSPATVRIAKTGPETFLANGLPGRTLVVRDSLDEMLETIGAITAGARLAG